MFIGEAPGRNEDELGLPFVGQAGKLLDKLLGEIGLTREDVFIANVLKCRPPGNRDPQPTEIEQCRDYLDRQVELIEPRVICTLGNFSTKLLRADTPASRACTAGGGARRRPAGGAAVSALPPRGRALHAVDAGDPAGRLPAHSRAPGAARPDQPEPVPEAPEIEDEPEPEPGPRRPPTRWTSSAVWQRVRPGGAGSAQGADP